MEIRVKRCAHCGALEDVHARIGRDDSVTLRLECACGQGEAREITIPRGEKYWLTMAALPHTDETGGEGHDGDDPDPDSGDV